MKIKIKHDTLGEIVIHSELPKDVQETIGDVTPAYEKFKFYYGKIEKIGDHIYKISELMVIKPKTVSVGWMGNSKGNCDFVSLMHNLRVLDELTVYPSGILYIEENQDEK